MQYDTPSPSPDGALRVWITSAKPCSVRVVTSGRAVHDREDEWLVLGRGPESAALGDEAADYNTRECDDDFREARDREPRDRDDDRGGLDPRDVFMRDLDLPRGQERETWSTTAIATTRSTALSRARS